MIGLYALNQYRVRGKAVVKLFGNEGDDKGGVFQIPSSVDSTFLRVIASNGDGWDHVSVSREDRCPTWEEMEFIKRLFFGPDETAMQLHVEAAEHISFHPFCLHLWAPHAPVKIPRPPAWMVGPKEEKVS